MNNNKYFLPINSNLLASHVGKGIILPRKYLKDSIVDIQSTFSNFLLLINKTWIEGDSSNDCSLEIVLTDSERKSLLQFEDFALLNDGLPISRIKKFHFKNEEQKNKTIYNINQGDGFVPELISSNNTDDFVRINVKENIESFQSENLIEKANSFNRLLGAFACMQLTGKISKYYKSNYSENYFATLGSINNVIAKDCEICNFPTKSNLLGIFLNNKEPKWNRDFLVILKNSFSNEDSFFQELKKYAKYNNNMDLIEAIKSPLGIKWDYLKEADSYSIALAMLYRYGQGKRKSTTDLFNDMLSGKMPFSKKIESLLFLYGFHYGYEQFRNKEGLLGKEECIKYKMNSLIDYFTIESIYQYAFKGVYDSEDFEYLSSWCPKYNEPSSVKTYIIDVPVYGILKFDSDVYLKFKEKVISFLADNQMFKFSNKLLDEIKKEISEFVDPLLTDVKKLEDEYEVYKTKFQNAQNIIVTFKSRIKELENEIVFLKDTLSQSNNKLTSDYGNSVNEKADSQQSQMGNDSSLMDRQVDVKINPKKPYKTSSQKTSKKKGDKGQTLGI
jgi:hypothetical protein